MTSHYVFLVSCYLIIGLVGLYCAFFEKKSEPEPEPETMTPIDPRYHDVVHCARYGSVADLRRMLEAGANPDSLFGGTIRYSLRYGFTAISYLIIEACKNYRNDFPAKLELLVRAGGKISVFGDADPTLHHVIWSNGHPAIIKKLVELGVDVNERDLLGRTALHYALENDKRQTYVRCLLSLGADVEVRTQCGLSPLQLALEWKWDDGEAREEIMTAIRARSSLATIAETM